jgi:uncharacterized protein (TIGR03437 family)
MRDVGSKTLYASRLRRIAALIWLLQPFVSGQVTCGIPTQSPVDEIALLPEVTFEEYIPGGAQTCDPVITVLELAHHATDTLYAEVTTYYPCTGQSKKQEYDLKDAGGETTLGDALAGLCSMQWVQMYFPAALQPGFRRMAAPKATSASLPSTGQSSQGIAYADLNGDGNPDEIFISGAGIRVELLDAGGNVLSTSLLSPGFSTAGGLSNDIIAADFNGDGKPDLAVTNAGASGTNMGNAVVFPGNGDGTFGSPLALNAGPNPLSLAAADFNGDGKLDLAFANQASANSMAGYGPGAVTVVFGKGDGTFGTPATYAVGENSIGFPDALLAVDLNSDGQPDLAVANRNDNSISILINSGGVFKPAIITPLSIGVETIVYGDFNNDGKPDLLAASSHSGALAMLFGKGDGTFQPPGMTASVNMPSSIGLLPLSDGTTLAATADSISGTPFFTVISPQGSVGAPPLNFVGGMPTGVAAADLNGDGQPDAVAAASNGVVVFLANQDGFQSPATYSLAAPPSAVAIGDMNGDGKPDVVTANADGSVSFLPGTGNGQLGQAITTSGTDVPLGIALADFNGDGKLDAAVASYQSSLAASGPGSVLVFPGNGDGTFQSPLTLAADGLNAQAVATGDLNGDGIPDIAAIMVSAPGQPATLAVFLGQAGGTFQTARTTTLMTLGGAQGGIAIGDFNRDGKPDIAAFGNYNGQIDVLLGDGTGAFHEAAATPTSTDASAAALAVADVNGDGIPDLITTGSYLIGNGDGTFIAEQRFLSASFTTAIAGVKTPANVGIFSVGQAQTFVATYLVLPSAAALIINADVSSANPTLATIAPSSIATAYGANLATGTADSNGPPPDSLAGATVTIVDSSGTSRPAPVFYASPTQINYYVPDGTATGNATVDISAGGLTSSITTPVAAVAPGIFALNASGLIAAIVVDVGPSGAQSFTDVYQVGANNSVAPLPVDLSAGQVYLEIYGTGIRNAANVAVTVGGVSVPVLSSGAEGVDLGLDQINAGPLPQSLQGKGQVNVTVAADGQAANVTNITIK